MRRFVASIAFALTICGAIAVCHAADTIPKPIAAAVADAERPAADKERDVNRKPAEVIAFAGVKPGDKVADLLPGGGYFTRIFSKVVGSKGHVYAMMPAEILKFRANGADGIKAVVADKAYSGNTTLIMEPLAEFKWPQKLDMVWTSQNYHDFRLAFLGKTDMAVLNKKIFAALKPGGVYLVLDHAATPGSGDRDSDTLHRIDEDLVKQEVTAAGFVLDGESEVLRNPEDNHTAKVFDPAIRGRTDQFILKFRKPRS